MEPEFAEDDRSDLERRGRISWIQAYASGSAGYQPEPVNGSATSARFPAHAAGREPLLWTGAGRQFSRHSHGCARAAHSSLPPLYDGHVVSQQRGALDVSLVPVSAGEA